MARPWCGEDYSRTSNPIGGLRLMILGESHYHDDAPIGSFVEDIHEYVIDEVLRGKRYPFMNKLSRLFITGGRRPCTQNESFAFWNSVVFYNYIPMIVGNKPRDRPRDDMWLGETPKRFMDIVRTREIEAILVCGKELWWHLPAGLPGAAQYQSIGKIHESREYEVGLPYRAVAAHIPHPSGFGWKYEPCRPVVDLLYHQANSIRSETGEDPITRPPERG